jgi:hypothetical protein
MRVTARGWRWRSVQRLARAHTVARRTAARGFLHRRALHLALSVRIPSDFVVLAAVTLPVVCGTEDKVPFEPLVAVGRAQLIGQRRLVTWWRRRPGDHMAATATATHGGENSHLAGGRGRAQR